MVGTIFSHKIIIWGKEGIHGLELRFKEGLNLGERKEAKGKALLGGKGIYWTHYFWGGKGIILGLNWG